MTMAVAASVSFGRPLPAVPALDRAVFSDGDCLAMGDEEARELRVDAIRTAVSWHAGGCEPYGRLVDQRGFDPEQISSVADLDAVPVLPTSIFKRTAVRTEGAGPIIRSFRSSGTQGALSVVMRDEVSLQRLLGSVRCGLRLLGDDLDYDETEVVNLGPPRSAAGDVWFSYVMSLVELLAETRHHAQDGLLDVPGAAADLAEAAERVPHVFLVGPPPFVAELAAHVAEANVAVPPRRLTVMTGGGWKRDDGGALDGEGLGALLRDAFPAVSRLEVRDAFNQVELNSVLMECAHGRKHAPPWLHCTARDEHLEPLPGGTAGLLSFLDPTAVSFPCFLVGDDVARVSDERCSCGAVGQTVDVVRRLARPASEGCSLKLQARRRQRA